VAEVLNGKDERRPRVRAKEPKMKIVKCDQCDEPRTSFIGPEKKPLANFCNRHGRAVTRANVKRRGKLIEAAIMARELNTLVAKGHMSVSVVNGENRYSLTPAGTRYVETKLLKRARVSGATP